MTRIGRKPATLLLSVTMVVTCMSVLGTQTAYAIEPNEAFDFHASEYINGLTDGKIIMENEFSFDPEKLIGLNDELMGHYLAGEDFEIYTYGRDDEYLLYNILDCDKSGVCRRTISYYTDALGDALQIVFVFNPGAADEKRFSSEFIDIAADISKHGEVYDIESTRTYTGKAQIQPISVFYNSMGLEDKDYNVTYKNNKNVGEAQVIVKGTGNYVGQIVKTFHIKAAAISKTSAATIKAQTYTGKALTPDVKLTFNDKTLKSGIDYTVAYKANKAVGTANVTVTGKGNFTGTKKLYFKINKAANPMTVKGKTASIKYSSVKKKAQTVTAKKVFTVSKAQGKVTYKKANGDKSITVSSGGKITVKKGTKKGTHKIKVKVTAKGNGNYNAATKTATVTIKVK